VGRRLNSTTDKRLNLHPNLRLSVLELSLPVPLVDWKTEGTHRGVSNTAVGFRTKRGSIAQSGPDR